MSTRGHFSLILCFLCVAFVGCTSPGRSGPTSELKVESDGVLLSQSSLKTGTKTKTVSLDHGFFVVNYDPALRLARYVKYSLTAENLKKSFVKRTGRERFFADPLLSPIAKTQVLPAEYKKSGYDQGHMAPAADFAWSKKASEESYVMSNMAPQTPNLNRASWRLLELQVRKWACGEEKITVYTGPVIEEKMGKLKSGLAVPNRFFKVVFDETPPTKVIAFIYNQTDKGNLIKERVVPLDELRSLVGFDFTSDIEDSLRPSMRSPAGIESWHEADCIGKAAAHE